jgi:hypothetical protein
MMWTTKENPPFLGRFSNANFSCSQSSVDEEEHETWKTKNNE